MAGPAGKPSDELCELLLFLSGMDAKCHQPFGDGLEWVAQDA